MNEYLSATILGLVQGLTEFLPVSSTGHLIITSHLLGLTDARVDTFEVVIQLGSILAVVFLYFNRFLGLLLPARGGKFAGIRGIFLLMLTCLPASLLGLLAHSSIKTFLFNPVSVSLALAVGALFILLVERMPQKNTFRSMDEVTPALALGIGCFQCLSLWPGFSRSASTIMGGMILGANRSLAAEYSFVAAVPIMFAATGFDLYKSASFLAMTDLPFFLTGTAVAFFSAMLAIKLLMRLITRISFRPFAWYRLALAPLVFLFFQ
jgi:undecaprenyl-diphosphatase UppP